MSLGCGCSRCCGLGLCVHVGARFGEFVNWFVWMGTCFVVAFNSARMAKTKQDTDVSVARE